MKDVKKNQRVLKIDAFNDFIDKNNFVGFTSQKITTSMKNGEEKKNVIYPSKWQMINHETKNNFINRYDGAYFIICGEVSNLTGLDFDNQTIFDKFMTKFPNNYLHVKTRKGHHIYFNYCKEINTLTNENIGLDFRNDGGNLISFPTSYNLLDGTTVKYELIKGEKLDITEEMLQWFIDEGIIYQRKEKLIIQKMQSSVHSDYSDNTDKETNTTVIDEEVNFEKIIDFLDKVNPDLLGDRSNWFRFQGSCFNIGSTFKQCDHICKKSKGYNYEENLKTWNSNKKISSKAGWSVLKEFIPKEDYSILCKKYFVQPIVETETIPSMKFNSVVEKKMDLNLYETEYDFMMVVYKYTIGEIIYKDSFIYIYYNSEWKKQQRAIVIY
jgi:hypothetical protein